MPMQYSQNSAVRRAVRSRNSAANSGCRTPVRISKNQLKASKAVSLRRRLDRRHLGAATIERFADSSSTAIDSGRAAAG